MEPTIASAGLCSFLTEIFAPLLLCSSIPLGAPPVQDPMLGRIAPEECVFYVGWSGIGVPDPKSTNSAERFLADPEVRHMRAEAARRFRLLCKSRVNLEMLGMLSMFGIDGVPPAYADDVITWSELVATQPCAFFLTGHAGDAKTKTELNGAFVVNVGDAQKHVAAMLERYKKMAVDAIEKKSVDGNTEYRIKGDAEWHLCWSLQGRYFVITFGKETPSKISQRMKGEEPKWFADIAKQLSVERRAAVVRLDCVRLRLDCKAFYEACFFEAKQHIDAIGFKNLRSFTLVTGLDREGFVSRAFVEADKETAARWQKIVARPLKADDLAVIPRDATYATMVNIDPSQLAACLAWLQENLVGTSKESNSSQDASQIVTSIAQGDLSSASSLAGQCVKLPVVIDKELRDGLASSLGETWRFYTSPSEGSLMFLNVTGVVRVKDRTRLVKTFDSIAARKPAAKKDEKVADKKDGKKNNKKKDEKAEAKKQGELVVRKNRFAEHDVYLFQQSDGTASSFAACCIVGDELVFSASPQNIKAYLLREAGRPSLAEESGVKETLGAKQTPSMIFYEDTRETFRLTYPLTQLLTNTIAAKAGLRTGGPDPMLLPSAPTVMKYLKPAVSTLSVTPQGMEIVTHQSLPNGNLGSSIYMVLCSSLPENPNAWCGESGGGKSAEGTLASKQHPPYKFPTFTEKEGPCTIPRQKVENSSVPVEPVGKSTKNGTITRAEFEKLNGESREAVVELGKDIKAVCKFKRSEVQHTIISGEVFVRRTVDVNTSIKNNSKERHACLCHVAFFDKNGKLVGSCGLDGFPEGIAPGEESNFGCCCCYLSDEQIDTITSYKIRFYESEPLPEPKKK